MSKRCESADAWLYDGQPMLIIRRFSTNCLVEDGDGVKRYVDYDQLKPWPLLAPEKP